MLIGYGGHRLVFDMGNGVIKKVPKRNHFIKGVEQNKNEYYFYHEFHKDYPFLATVIGMEGDDLFMEKVDILDSTIYGNTLDFNRLSYNITNDRVIDFINKHQFLSLDIFATHHWGVNAQGVLKLVDYGINLDFIKRYGL